VKVFPTTESCCVVGALAGTPCIAMQWAWCFSGSKPQRRAASRLKAMPWRREGFAQRQHREQTRPRTDRGKHTSLASCAQVRLEPADPARSKAVSHGCRWPSSPAQRERPARIGTDARARGSSIGLEAPRSLSRATGRGFAQAQALAEVVVDLPRPGRARDQQRALAGGTVQSKLVGEQARHR